MGWISKLSKRASRRRGAFTLIEILVVLSIAAVVSAITIGGFESIREGNKRTSCQSNLSQIYQACRLYSQDYSAYPYYNPGVATGTTTPSGGVGLWALYTYPLGGTSTLAPTNSGVPVRSYLRNLASLHCPNDYYERPAGGGLYSSIPFSADNVLNPDYLSYQVDDDVPAGTSTYSVFRGDGIKRQLDYYTVNSGTATRSRRPLDDTTIITWCRFHRRLNGAGVTGTSARNFDNVLFSDGSVQLLAASQPVVYVDAANTPTGSGTCTGWNRVPRDMSQSLPDSDVRFSCP